MRLEHGNAQMEYATAGSFFLFSHLAAEIRVSIWKLAASQLRLAPVWLSVVDLDSQDWLAGELERLTAAAHDVETAHVIRTNTEECRTAQEAPSARTLDHGVRRWHQLHSAVDPLLLACRESRAIGLESASRGKLLTQEDPPTAVAFNYERDILTLHSKYPLQTCGNNSHFEAMFTLRALEVTTLNLVKHVAIELVAAHEQLQRSRWDECRRRTEELVTLLCNVETIGLIESRSVVDGTSPDKLVFFEVIDLEASISTYNDYFDHPSTIKCPDAIPLRRIWPPSSWRRNKEMLQSSLNYHRATHSNSKASIKKVYWRLLVPEDEAVAFRKLQHEALTISSIRQSFTS